MRQQQISRRARSGDAYGAAEDIPPARAGWVTDAGDATARVLSQIDAVLRSA